MTTVSVIIPVYNQADFAEEALRSALTQEYRDREIIVVDDGSTDETPEILKRFQNKIKVIRQENRGLSAARNAGIRVAKGKYIGLLDADDIWSPDFLSKMAPLLKSASPNFGAAYCGFFFLDRHGTRMPNAANPVTPQPHFKTRLRRANFLNVCAVLVRREVYEAEGLFDENLSACEDWDMWLRVAERYDFVGIPDCLVTMVTVRTTLGPSIVKSAAMPLSTTASIPNKVDSQPNTAPANAIPTPSMMR